MASHLYNSKLTETLVSQCHITGKGSEKRLSLITAHVTIQNTIQQFKAVDCSIVLDDLASQSSAKCGLIASNIIDDANLQCLIAIDGLIANNTILTSGNTVNLLSDYTGKAKFQDIVLMQNHVDIQHEIGIEPCVDLVSQQNNSHASYENITLIKNSC